MTGHWTPAQLRLIIHPSSFIVTALASGFDSSGNQRISDIANYVKHYELR